MTTRRTDSFIFRPTITKPVFTLKTIPSMRGATLARTPIKYQVNWGDSEEFELRTGIAEHTYSIPSNGEKFQPTITIFGSFPVLNFAFENGLEIVQWGSIPFEHMEYAFSDCRNLTFSATDQPNLSKVRSLRGLFFNCDINEPLNNWDVSQVTDMAGMFFVADNFNQPLNRWDVSKVTDMAGMFHGASQFNQPLNRWDVSKVTDMAGMFFGAKSFNQPLDRWDVSQVTDMSGMFESAWSFNQPLDSWDVSKVTDMSNMFNSTPMSSMSKIPEWYRVPNKELQLIQQAGASERVFSKRLDLQRVFDELEEEYGPNTAQFVSIFLDERSAMIDVYEVLIEIKNSLDTTYDYLETDLTEFLRNKRVRPLFSNESPNVRPCKNERSVIDFVKNMYLQPDTDIVYDSDGYCYTREEFQTILENAPRFRNPNGVPFSRLQWSDSARNQYGGAPEQEPQTDRDMQTLYDKWDNKYGPNNTNFLLSNLKSIIDSDATDEEIEKIADGVLFRKYAQSFDQGLATLTEKVKYQYHWIKSRSKINPSLLSQNARKIYDNLKKIDGSTTPNLPSQNARQIYDNLENKFGSTTANFVFSLMKSYQNPQATVGEIEKEAEKIMYELDRIVVAKGDETILYWLAFE
ncbi:MAG TPA: BspA family leucine-rich repeat surface protein [Candidatus Woesebacteria bacterium]|nr:BspA family leucine-rich repeat surface protein [Candidatus Woesebacteria bacterium]